MNSTDTPRNLCPACGYLIDAASALAGRGAPRPGDVSMCLSCGEVLMFDDALRSVVPPPWWLGGMPPRVRLTVTQMQTLIRARGPLPPGSTEGPIQ